MKYATVSLISVFSICFLISACTSSREAQKEEIPEPPAPEYYVAQNISARGGFDKLKSIQTLKLTGEIQMMGMALPITLYQKRPNKTRNEVEIQGMGATVITGFDGNTGWTKNPMLVPEIQVLPDNLTEVLEDNSDIDGILVNYKSKGYTIEYLGEADVREKPAYKLRVIRPERSDVIIYLDKETFLEVKVEGKGIDYQMGKVVDAVMYLGDYRDVEGIKTAHLIEVETAGQVQQVLELNSVEVNPQLEDEMFASPQS